MMRKIDVSDFETANIGYIEFWLMDPFITAQDNAAAFSGDLYFNLGEISEDILKDGKNSMKADCPLMTILRNTRKRYGDVYQRKTVSPMRSTPQAAHARSKTSVSMVFQARMKRSFPPISSISTASATLSVLKSTIPSLPRLLPTSTTIFVAQTLTTLRCRFLSATNASTIPTAIP